jgi:hypothetical protein
VESIAWRLRIYSFVNSPIEAFAQLVEAPDAILMHGRCPAQPTGLARKALRSIADSPVNYERTVFLPAENMDQTYYS